MLRSILKFFQQVNLDQIPAHAVSPTTLIRCYPETSRDEGLSSVQSAQVNHGSQFLLLSQADLCTTPCRHIDHLVVKVRGSHFDRMARYGPCIEAVEPAGT